MQTQTKQKPKFLTTLLSATLLAAIALVFTAALGAGFAFGFIYAVRLID